MQRVFVSYSRRDKNFAERLARDLSDAGLDVWIDFRQIHGGEMWQNEIYKGIQRSDMLIACLSPDAITSYWVNREILTAREQSKFILPIMIVPALDALQENNDLQWLLDVHFIQFDERYEAAFKELLTALPGKRRVGAFDDIDIATIPNPFKGLEAFQQTDAAFFFGREGMVDKALKSLKNADRGRFLAVIGASGSGKSSIVRAGVIPRLRQGALPGSEHWRLALFTPGEHPVNALATRLTPLLGEDRDAAALTTALNGSLTSLVEIADEILAGAPQNCLLVLLIDQFEETFTRASDDEAERFLNLLHATATHRSGRVQIIITMRADFFDRLGRYPQIAELFEQENMVIVTEMTPANLLRSIEGPAQAVGLVYEDGLSARILEDVRKQPGSLPLLQYALKALYEKRDGRTLTHAAYDSTGGVQKALAGHAEGIYTGLKSAQQDLMRRILLRLVEITPTGEATRRRINRDELLFKGISAQSVEDLVDLMTASESRLLVASREIVTNTDVVSTPVIRLEVSHEALIREWERYRGWIIDNMEDLRYSGELLKAAQDWEMSGKDSAYLLGGNRLLRAEEWWEDADPNPLQRVFVEASVAERRRREELSRQQAERELGLQRTATQRLRVIAVVLLVALIGAVGLIGFAFSERQRAEENAIRAEENLIIAEQNAQEAAKNAREARENLLKAEENARIAEENLQRAEENAQRAEENAIEAQENLLQAQENARIAEANAQEAAENAARAERSAAEARSFALSVNAERALENGDGDLALALAVDSTLTLDSAPPEARLSLARVAFASGARRILRESTLTSAVSAVAYSRDNTTVYAGGDDGFISVWDVQSGRLLRRLRDETSGGGGGGGLAQSTSAGNAFTSLVLTPDQLRLIAGTQGGTILVFDLTSGDVVRRLTGHTRAVNVLHLNPAGDRLLSGGNDNLIFMWNTNTGERLFGFNEHRNAVIGLGFNPQIPSQAVSMARDGVVLIFETQTPAGTATRRFSVDVTAVTSALSPDGRFLAVGGTRGIIQLWRLHDAPRAPELLFTITGHGDEAIIRTLTFSPDSQRLASGGSDETVMVWNTATGERLHFFSGHQRDVRALAFNVDGSRLLSGSRDATLRVWDLNNAAIVRDFVGHQARAIAIYSPDGRSLISGGADRILHLWDIATGRIYKELVGHEDAVLAVAVNSDGTRILSGSADDTLRLWEVDSGESQVLRGHTSDVQGIRFVPGTDDAIAISAGRDGAIIVWNIATGEEVRRLGTAHLQTTDQGVFALDVTRDGRLAATAGDDGRITVWDITSGAPVMTLEGHARPIRALAFSPDAGKLVSGAINGDVFVWDLNDGAQLLALVGHNRSVQSVEFSPDGQSVLSGALDASIRVWDIASGLEVRQYTLEDRTLNLVNVVFSANGETVVSGLTDGRLRLWRLYPDVPSLLAWTFANRHVPELTCQQREQFRLIPLCSAESPVVTREIPPLPALAPPVVSVVTPLQVGMEVTVQVTDQETLRLRSAPSLNNSTIQQLLPINTRLTLLEGPRMAEGFEWWRVRTPNGFEGWAVGFLNDPVRGDQQTLVPDSTFEGRQ